jgi:hypothetical protein
VSFYDEDAELVARVAAFVLDGFALGARAIVVGTARHRSLLDDALRELGLDLMASRHAGRLVSLDAEETLATFMAGGAPDPQKFRSTVGGLIDTATADGSPVRVFGEMVAVLWQQGNVAGAIELESLWNDLAEEHRFTLLCAYPLTAVGESSLGDLDRVCELHSRLEPPRSYLSGAPSAPAVGVASNRSSKVFVCVPAAVPAARRFVAGVLTEWAAGELIPDAVLVASELATNAVRHARSPFRVVIDRSGASLRIAVEDVGDTHPVLCRPPDDATCGRGVFVVAVVCRVWGSDSLPQGKVVWADLASTSL